MALKRSNAFLEDSPCEDIEEISSAGSDPEPNDPDVSMMDIVEIEDHGEDFAELYSPPRVSVHLRLMGLKANVAIDLETGYDMNLFEVRRRVDGLLSDVRFIMMSPPCTMYSQMQTCFRNFEKMKPELLAEKWVCADSYLDGCMNFAKRQASQGKWFAFEHPLRASSWKRASVQEVMALEGVQTVRFDQCVLGLKSPVKEEPIKKPTTIMSNSQAMIDAFTGVTCRCIVPHKQIQGSEGGIQLSKYCQVYPPPMARKLAEAVRDTLEQQR